MKENNLDLKFWGESLASTKHPFRNEDSIYLSPEDSLAVVLDGVGGGPDGDKASALASDAVSKFLKKRSAKTVKGWENLVEKGIQKASSRIAKTLSEEAGTTIVMAKFVDYDQHKIAVIGNVGDSRCYLLRNQKISQLSYDDDDLNDLVRLKLVFPKLATSIREKLDEIKTYDELRGAAGVVKGAFYDRNILSNMLGKQMRRKANITHKRIRAGDILILTSDGVHDNLTNNDIKEILLSDNDDPAKKLVEEAQKISINQDREVIRSKPDDISAVVVYVASE